VHLGLGFACSNTDMNLAALLICFVLSAPMAAQTPTTSSAAEDYSGMYSFMRDGEFVQLTIEDDGKVSGFISRYGDTDSDRGAFIDQFFKEAKLDGTKLSFTTATVHGVWYEFKGTIERGPGKATSEEAYYILKGMLTEYRTDADKKVTSKSREASFKSFPREG